MMFNTTVCDVLLSVEWQIDSVA